MATQKANGITVELSGPLFAKPARVPINKAARKLVTVVSTKAKQNYRKSLTLGHGRKEGDYRKTIRKKSKKLTSIVFSENKAISWWLETGRRNKRQTKFRGYKLWQHAAEATDRTAGRDARAMGKELARALGGR